ncbi:MAG: pyridoxal phosphate-dependent aminotransferase [Eubacteriales bacterium]|nr:pyridoxal phosphate-dependent aminotransferase [Eubacteriales bacterium]MDD4286003.1 pyridoxal phosphate-dependent aminotransferase [Eubacteriales bacterium]HPF19399.1 pyridoxal phosphate-dependent aminotransferase [Bacillota bacterium]
MKIEEKFEKMGVDHAPGQEVRRRDADLPLRGEALPGAPVDFSHGDVDAHPPIPGALQTFVHGFYEGGKQAYTEYRGRESIRVNLAKKLSGLTGCSIDAGEEMILTPGTQGALFLAMGATVARGDKVAYVEPDYFANRKMVEFFEGEKLPVFMNWRKREQGSGLDLEALEKTFQDGARLFLFSNPNNPTGAVCSREEMEKIASLSRTYGVTVIADELYARQMYDGAEFVHFSGLADKPDHLLTIIGPSKTESMSGFRLGVAFGTPALIRRMEKLQAIMTLRCSGYNQAVFADWLSEPEGWLDARVAAHQAIRDGLLEIFRRGGMEAATPRGGSYLFVRLPKLAVEPEQFISLLRIQARVIVTPGTEFGPQFADWFRINFSQDHDKAMDAAARIVLLKDRYRKEKERDVSESE